MLRRCSMEGRPQKPLDHVYARRIDVIVVYEVDRLTCALAEFAKLASWSRRRAFPSFGDPRLQHDHEHGAADARHALLEVGALEDGAGPSLQSNANARSCSRAASLKSFKGSIPLTGSRRLP